MGIEQLYEEAIRPLSPVDRLRLARLILDGIPPESMVDYSDEWTDEDLRDFSAAGWARLEADDEDA